jgi:NADPH-dependent 2,4-dienoyl-CoA reductase/sulfur reductase-like enzyme
VKFVTNCWPIAAEGGDKVESVTLRAGPKTWKVPCDYLACGFHLVPNVELAIFLGCRLSGDFVQVDLSQRTSAADIYCAGEPTGIGGLELSLVEGQIAGYAATSETQRAEELFAERDALREFAVRLNRTFALRPELRSLATPETFVCRCEDVELARLREHKSWRSAKLHTRCGMGPCQGRICGPALEFLLGWKVESIRPPVFPVQVETLAARELVEK